jgi:hypothetical protein
MSGTVVCIRSYLTVWEADWQRSLLADAGIPSGADNCAVVLWAWHYTQVVGGVKLYIDDARLAEAVAILAGSMPDDHAPPESMTTVRDCPQCGAELPADWDVCWQCSAVLEDNAKVAMSHESEASEDVPQTVRPIVAVLLLTWAVISHGLVFGAELLALIVAAHFVVGHWAARMSPLSEDAEPDAALPDPPRRSEVGEAVALRAWRTAAFGCIWFPPLLLYALYLLVRLGWRRFELSPMGRARHGGAIATVLFSPVRWGALLLYYHH